LAAALANGQSLREAVAKARAYVRRKIERAIRLGGMDVAD
jgi:hydroxymethylpyrimidine/phosphomethylpyrimidine kinase